MTASIPQIIKMLKILVFREFAKFILLNRYFI
jgi:hypothetical protein